jgi:hypothetical protein
MNSSPEAPLPSAAPIVIRRRARPLVPLVLLLLALFDLRVEFLLLADGFTLTTLTAAIRNHGLAAAVLLFQPSLWRQYGRSVR